MKSLTFTLLAFVISLPILSAQNEDRDKYETLQYYISSIRNDVESARYYTDSIKVLNLLDEINTTVDNIDIEVEAFIVPETVMLTETEEIDDIVAEEEMPAEDWNNDTDGDNGRGVLGNMSKYMPFKNKSKTKFTVEVGINSLQQTLTGAQTAGPDLNNGGSWYWDFGIQRQLRIGGNNSKVAFNYGISYLLNRFKFEEDVRLTTIDGNPAFVPVADAKNDPKLNIGYLTVPLGFSFKMGKKFTLNLGGYAGYRVHTVQKIKLRTGNETIEEKRYSSNQLNNWVYGGQASIDINGFDIVARYNLSPLFKDNPNFDYNTFMIGTSFSFF